MKVSLDPQEALAVGMLLHPALAHDVSIETRPERQMHSFAGDTYSVEYEVDIRVRCTISSTQFEAISGIAAALRGQGPPITLDVD